MGRERLEDREQYGKAIEEANRVYNLFKDQIGQTLCEEIHRSRFGKVYHLIVAEEREAFHQAGGHSRTGCPEVCGVAARIAAQIILDIREKSS